MDGNDRIRHGAQAQIQYKLIEASTGLLLSPERLIDVTVGARNVMAPFDEALIGMNVSENKSIVVHDDFFEEISSTRSVIFQIRVIKFSNIPCNTIDLESFLTLASVSLAELRFLATISKGALVISKTFDICNAQKIGQEFNIISSLDNALLFDAENNQKDTTLRTYDTIFGNHNLSYHIVGKHMTLVDAARRCVLLECQIVISFEDDFQEHIPSPSPGPDMDCKMPLEKGDEKLIIKLESVETFLNGMISVARYKVSVVEGKDNGPPGSSPLIIMSVRSWRRTCAPEKRLWTQLWSRYYGLLQNLLSLQSAEQSKIRVLLVDSFEPVDSMQYEQAVGEKTQQEQNSLLTAAEADVLMLGNIQMQSSIAESWLGDRACTFMLLNAVYKYVGVATATQSSSEKQSTSSPRILHGAISAASSEQGASDLRVSDQTTIPPPEASLYQEQSLLHADTISIPRLLVSILRATFSRHHSEHSQGEGPPATAATASLEGEDASAALAPSSTRLPGLAFPGGVSQAQYKFAYKMACELARSTDTG